MDEKLIDTEQYLDKDGVLTTSERDIYDKNCCRPVKLRCVQEEQKKGETIQKCTADRGKLCCDSKDTGCTCTELKEFIKNKAIALWKADKEKKKKDPNDYPNYEEKEDKKTNKIRRQTLLSAFRSKQITGEKINPKCKSNKRR